MTLGTQLWRRPVRIEGGSSSGIWLILCVTLAGSQYLVIWPNVFLDVSVKVFLDEVNI